MNYRIHLDGLRENRDSWLALLNKNPDDLKAAQQIVIMNSQIQYIDSLRMMDGD